MFRLAGLLHRRNRIRGHTFGQDPKLLAGISLSSNLNDLFRGEPTYLRPNTIPGPSNIFRECHRWRYFALSLLAPSLQLSSFLPSFFPSFDKDRIGSIERVSFIRSWYTRESIPASADLARVFVLCILQGLIYRACWYVVREISLTSTMIILVKFEYIRVQNSIIYCINKLQCSVEPSCYVYHLVIL